jgi:hypothetical protein
MYVYEQCIVNNILLLRETEEKARQPETKQGAIAHTWHKARLRNARRSRSSNPKPTNGAQNRPQPPQSRAGQDRTSGSGQRLASRHTRPTDTGTHCPLYMNMTERSVLLHPPLVVYVVYIFPVLASFVGQFCPPFVGSASLVFRPVSRPVCGFGVLVWLRFALRSLAMWRVCAIAPTYASGWRAFSSVSLCEPIFIAARVLAGVLRPALRADFGRVLRMPRGPGPDAARE